MDAWRKTFKTALMFLTGVAIAHGATGNEHFINLDERLAGYLEFPEHLCRQVLTVLFKVTTNLFNL